MAIYPRGGCICAGGYETSSSTITTNNYWLVRSLAILSCLLIGYIIYDVVMATATELLQRLLTISPLLIIFVVHWLSSSTSRSNCSSLVGSLIPGSDPTDIHRAGGSPWGLAFILLVLFLLISYQPSFYALNIS